MRSILALDSVDFSKHAGIISYFRRQYIKTGVFDVELSDIIGEAFERLFFYNYTQVMND